MSYPQYQANPMSRRPRPVAKRPSAFAPLYGGLPPQAGGLAQAAAQRIMAQPKPAPQGGWAQAAQQAMAQPQQPAGPMGSAVQAGAQMAGLPPGMTPEMARMLILRNQAQQPAPRMPRLGNINSQLPNRSGPQQPYRPMSISGVRG